MRFDITLNDLFELLDLGDEVLLLPLAFGLLFSELDEELLKLLLGQLAEENFSQGGL